MTRISDGDPDELLCFGRTMQHDNDGSFYELVMGLLCLQCYNNMPSLNGHWTATIRQAQFESARGDIARAELISTKEVSRDWLESEARRISREMIEMAGPMIAQWNVIDYGNGTSSANVATTNGVQAVICNR